ncbi:MAG: branched-chain amino acid ABC transporter permease [Alphaproteobacteria bacterium]
MWRYALFAAGVVTIIALPFISDNYFVRIATFICMYATLALSWNFIGGFAGYPSFATAAFFGLGAYAGALSQRHGVPMVPAWIVASVVVAAWSAVLGYAIVRLRGHYFAIGSIASVEVLRLVISSWSDFTGGGEGLNVPIVPGGADYVGMLFLYIMLSITLIVFGIAELVARSRIGFGLHCICQNEDAASMVGINTTAYKVIAFVLSATFCGTVGAVYASWTNYIDPTDSFEIMMTLKVPVMALLGGAGTVLGPVLGATAFVTMEEVIWAEFLEYNRAVLGTVIVVLIFFLPGGLLRLPYRDILARIRRLAGLRDAG